MNEVATVYELDEDNPDVVQRGRRRCLYVGAGSR